MKIGKRVILVVAAFLVIILSARVIISIDQPYTVQALARMSGANASFPTGISYQGRLLDSSQPANGAYDLVFDLYGVESGGSLIDSVTQSAMDVADGLFMTTLPFDEGAFNGEARWLEIKVKKPSDGDYTTLTPRQPILPVPYALYASGGDPTVLQQRVSGTCADGGMVTTINEDGSVVCDPADERPVYQSVTLNPSLAFSTQAISADIGTDGLPVISTCTQNNNLAVIHCNDIACSSFNSRIIDNSANVCYGSSLAIGADGLPLISYHDQTNGDLKVAHCNDRVCSSPDLYILEDGLDVGEDSSIAIGVDGLGLISYTDNGNGYLKVAHCANTACSSADQISTPSTSGTVDNRTSLVIGMDGLGLISYRDGGLKTAHCNNANCTSSTISTHSGGGYFSDIVVSMDGFGLIVYSGGTGGASGNYVAHCSDLVCSTTVQTTINSNAMPGSSITRGRDGVPVIVYGLSSIPVNLRVAHCSDAACTQFTSIIAYPHKYQITFQTEIFIGVDGYPAILHTTDGLILTHCSNIYCLPYSRWP